MLGGLASLSDREALARTFAEVNWIKGDHEKASNVLLESIENLESVVSECNLALYGQRNSQA